MKKLKVGLIGLGRSGRDIHGLYLRMLPDLYQVVVAADQMADRRQRAEQEWGCETVADYHSFLGRRDLDLVINATPSHLHVPVTMEFLNQGQNLVCDKPVSRHAADVDTLAAAAQKNKCLFTAFHQLRYSPYFQQVQKVIASGVLGRLVQISAYYNTFGRRWDWQTLQEFDGGNLLNTGAHVVDQLVLLLGTDAMPKITCSLDRALTLGDAEDYVKAILKTPGKPVVDMEVSSCNAYPPFLYSLQGTAGGLIASISMERVVWKYFKPEEAPEQKLTLTPIIKPDGTPSYCREQLKWYEESWDQPKEIEYYSYCTCEYYRRLYRTITAGAPLEVTPEQVKQQILIIEECHRQNPLPIMDKK